MGSVTLRYHACMVNASKSWYLFVEYQTLVGPLNTIYQGFILVYDILIPTFCNLYYEACSFEKHFMMFCRHCLYLSIAGSCLMLAGWQLSWLKNLSSRFVCSANLLCCHSAEVGRFMYMFMVNHWTMIIRIFTMR